MHRDRSSLLDGVDDRTLAQIIERFYEYMLSDDRVARHFENVNLPKLRAHQRSFLVAALSQPGTYNALTLEHAHLPLRLRDADFDIAVDHLSASMLDSGIAAATVSAVAERLQSLRPHIVAADAR